MPGAKLGAAAVVAAALLVSGCAASKWRGDNVDPWEAQLQAAGCADLDGTYANRGAFGFLVPDMYFTPLASLAIPIPFTDSADGVSVQAIRIVRRPDGAVRVTALRQGAEVGALEIAAPVCRDGWLVISGDAEVMDPPWKRTESATVMIRAANDGALIVREAFVIAPGALNTRYARYERR